MPALNGNEVRRVDRRGDMVGGVDGVREGESLGLKWRGCCLLDLLVECTALCGVSAIDVRTGAAEGLIS